MSDHKFTGDRSDMAHRIKREMRKAHMRGNYLCCGNPATGGHRVDCPKHGDPVYALIGE